MFDLEEKYIEKGNTSLHAADPHLYFTRFFYALRPFFIFLLPYFKG